MNALSWSRVLPVPAFSFTQPWMLLGLVLAAIPVLIHFFYRRRYQEVRWAAVQFLDAAVKRNAQRHRFQQLLLLALRTLAIALLVFAFAGPMSNANLTLSQATGSRHVVVVIDGSLSMQCREADGTRFERAIDLAVKVVESSGEDDTFQLVQMAGSVPESIIAQPTNDRDQVRAALKGLECSFRRGEPERAWPLVLELLKQSNSGKPTAVHLFSDLQLHEWRDTATDVNKKLLADIAKQSDLTFVDVTDRLTPNLAVQNVSVDNDFVTVNETATLRAIVQNSSNTVTENRELRLVVDDRVVATRSVSVNPLTRLAVTFQHQFATRGRFRISFETDADQLTADDRAFGIVNVYDDVPLLLVNGKPSAQRMGQATDFLELCLNPAPEAGWKTPYKPRVVNEAELGTIDVQSYSVVFLCNVRQLTQSEVARLRSYVRSGGAVVVCVGDLVDIQNYNGRFFGKTGLMPGVRFQEVIGNSEEPLEAFELDAARLDHPLLSIYRGNPGHGLEQVLTFKYIRAAVSETSNGRTALQFRNGDPVIVESKLGAGIVCLTTIAGDDSRWSTWNTASGTYVTLMNELTQFAIRTSRSVQSTTVGEEWRRPIVASGSMTARLNDKSDLVPRVSRVESESELVIDEIPEPGFLSVFSETGTDEYLIAANVDVAESDLRSISESALRTEFLPGSEFRVRNAGTFLTADQRRTQAGGSELIFLLFALVVGLLISELLLASRVGLTEWLIFGTITIAIVCLMFLPASRVATLIVASVVIGGLLGRRYYRTAG
ncbi:MAG: BatA domain-containing protein [Planctomycetaceae bacterium]